GLLDRGAGTPDRVARLPALRLRNGAVTGVQWRWRHLDADLAQPGGVLDDGDSAGVVPGSGTQARAGRNILGDHGGVLRAGRRGCAGVAPRTVADSRGLMG